jgi:beta-lactamase superfamily II metal-dependent hydrolase
MAPKQGEKTVAFGGGLSFTVLGPNQQRVENLQKEWDKQREKLKKAGKTEAQAISAAFVDKSVYNLSSIILLATAGNRRMLLTGDARGDDIVAGLKSAGLFQGDRFQVDILKLPHHGSDRNIAPEFFERVTADHYVISANGKYGNPEIATLQMLSQARGQDHYTIHLTNQEDRLVDFFNQEKASGKTYDVRFRPKNLPSICIDLEEAIA